MKRRIFIALILVIAAAFIGRQMTHTNPETGGSGRDETHESFQLEDGARVEVRGINGSVEVTTAETDTADVRFIRTGDQDDLDNQRVIIEHTPSSLLVRVQNARGWGWHWFGGGAVRQQVILALPRRVELTAKGVNGPVKVGEVDGGVDVSGINGRVEVAKLSGHSELSGINGNVKVAVAQLDSEGMKVKGVNGGVEIRTGDGFAADINVKGLNGSVALNVPNVTMQERENRSNMRARLGAGGPSIEIKGINGGVRFESIAPVAPAAGQ